MRKVQSKKKTRKVTKVTKMKTICEGRGAEAAHTRWWGPARAFFFFEKGEGASVFWWGWLLVLLFLVITSLLQDCEIYIGACIISRITTFIQVMVVQVQ